jgi:hypothetical protein
MNFLQRPQFPPCRVSAGPTVRPRLRFALIASSKGFTNTGNESYDSGAVSPSLVTPGLELLEAEMTAACGETTKTLQVELRDIKRSLRAERDLLDKMNETAANVLRKEMETSRYLLEKRLGILEIQMNSLEVQLKIRCEWLEKHVSYWFIILLLILFFITCFLAIVIVAAGSRAPSPLL